MKTLDHWKYIVAGLSWRSSLLNLKLLNYLLDQTEPIDSLDKLIKVCPAEALKQQLNSDRNLWEKTQKDIEYCLQNNISLTVPGQFDYPVALFALNTPPLIISYRGQATWLSLPSLSVVGSRAPSESAITWMGQELTKFLELLPICIVSGGARGVDQEAHRVAIQSKCPTLCFLPSGLNNLYPSSLVHWTEFILASEGALVSQFPPGEFMQKSHFHKRNWLIAAMSPLTLVIEARRRSGSLLTAKAAMELGTQLSVLPCSPIHTNGLGGLDLLFDGAQLIRDATDLQLLYKQSESSMGFGRMDLIAPTESGKDLS